MRILITKMLLTDKNCVQHTKTEHIQNVHIHIYVTIMMAFILSEFVTKTNYKTKINAV